GDSCDLRRSCDLGYPKGAKGAKIRRSHHAPTRPFTHVIALLLVMSKQWRQLFAGSNPVPATSGNGSRRLLRGPFSCPLGTLLGTLGSLTAAGYNVRAVTTAAECADRSLRPSRSGVLHISRRRR